MNELKRSQVRDCVKGFGVKSTLSGFSYIVDAIMYVATIKRMEPEISVSISKEIYPVLAKAYCVPKQTIERNIRYALIKAWEKNDILKLSYDKSAPTNNEFITMVLGILKVC